MPLEKEFATFITPDQQLSDEQSKLFRNGLGKWATGVAIVAMRDDQGHRYGLTINSFASLSLNPPLVLWSLDKQAESVSAFEQKRPFNVSILSDHQQDLALKFASQEERFLDTPCLEGKNGAPIIMGASAFFECDFHKAIDGGDHILFIGKVTHHGVNEKNPLLFHNGMFKTIG